MQSVSSAALVTLYNMEQSSSPLIDQAGGQQAAATGSGQVYSVSGPLGFGNAVGLNANGGWQVSASDSAELRALANNFTVASWVYIDPGRDGKSYSAGSNGRFDRIIGDDAAWDADGWAFGIENTSATTNDKRLVFTKNGVADVYSNTTVNLTEGTWIHLAATVSSSAGVSFYVNGVLLNTNGNTANVITTNGSNGQPDPYGIGRAYGSGDLQWFAGRLDEVQVHNSVLTQSEIQALMIPEPASVVLIGLAGLGALLRRRR